MKMWTKKWNITKQISLSEMKVNEEDIVSIRKNILVVVLGETKSLFFSSSLHTVFLGRKSPHAVLLGVCMCGGGE